MITSESVNELAGSLSKAQGMIEGAKKDAANPFFKSKYADLESVWTACRKALTENGLSIVQGVESTATGAVIVNTRLLHCSGQWIEDSLSMTPKDQTPQSIGSAISYGRRYALAAMVGVYQTDDDAEAAQGRPASFKDGSGKLDTANVSVGAVQKATKAFRDALADRNDEAALRVHEDLNAEPEVYQAVKDAMTPKEGQSIRDAIIRAREARAKGKAAVAF